MMAKRKAYFLYRVEGKGDSLHRVWLYEELQKHDFNARKKQGWSEWRA